MRSKKILLVFFIALIVLMMNVNYVYAEGCSVKMSSDKQNYTSGQIVIITVSVSDISSSNGIYGLSGSLDYDTNVFEQITNDSNGNITSTGSKITALNDWGKPSYNTTPVDPNKDPNQILIYTTTPAKETQGIMQIALKVKNNAPLGPSVILLKGIQVSDGSDREINTSPASVSVNIKNASDNGGDIPVIGSPTPAPTTTPAPTQAPTGNGGGIILTPSQTPTAVATIKPSNLPQTGIEDMTPVLVGSLIMALVAYIAYRRYRYF